MTKALVPPQLLNDLRSLLKQSRQQLQQNINTTMVHLLAGRPFNCRAGATRQ